MRRLVAENSITLLRNDDPLSAYPLHTVGIWSTEDNILQADA